MRGIYSSHSLKIPHKSLSIDANNWIVTTSTLSPWARVSTCTSSVVAVPTPSGWDGYTKCALIYSSLNDRVVFHPSPLSYLIIHPETRPGDTFLEV